MSKQDEIPHSIMYNKDIAVVKAACRSGLYTQDAIEYCMRTRKRYQNRLAAKRASLKQQNTISRERQLANVLIEHLMKCNQELTTENKLLRAQLDKTYFKPIYSVIPH